MIIATAVDGEVPWPSPPLLDEADDEFPESRALRRTSVT
jgi:hypothetical protein